MVQTRLTQYVSVSSGHDGPLGPTSDPRPTGDASQPFKTLTEALQQVQPSTVLQVLPGTYSAATGEVFPLRVPAGVTLQGAASQGGSTIISGGGNFNSESFGNQTTTLLLIENAQVQDLTVTNPTERGTGIWLEDSQGIVRRCQLRSCRRDGVFVTGNSLPLIVDNRFQGNGASGISLVRNSKGEVRSNVFEQTGYGIAVSDEAAPLLQANQLQNNRSGIVLSRTARPVLRDNRAANNQEYGLVVLDNALPDLGQGQSWGGNWFVGNGRGEIQNKTASPLISVGNQVDPNRMDGTVTFVASQIPDRVAVPPVLLDAAPVSGTPEPPSGPEGASPSAEETPPPGETSRFQDLVGHWAAPFVNAMIDRGVVQGFVDGDFRPNTQVTRAQFAALVIASFPNSAAAVTPDSNRFSDVVQTFWARDVIYQARDRGFISGYPDGTFRPDQPLTRVQALVAIANGLNIGQANGQALGIFRDRAQIPSYAVGAVAAATQRRLVVNYPDPLTLNPLAAISRAEVVAILYQSLVDQGQAPAIASDYIVRPDTTSPAFTDIDNHWAKDFILAIANQGLIRGYEDGSFRANLPITRAQYATLLVNAFRPVAQKPATQFRDVPPDFWATEAIQQAYRAGFMSGFPDQTFSPEHHILRVQVIVSLINGLGLLQTAPTASSLNRYQDAQRIPTYAQAQVAYATELGMVVNYPDLNRLNPNSTATRAEVAALVYQAMVVQQQVVPIDSPYIVPGS
ncbi:MAG: S-layer homology domain-containing protein [Cyanobacteria bacterium J06659_2]